MVTISDDPAGSDRPKRAERQRERLEAIGRLASGVAHDFANLVTLISGYSEMVLQRMHPHDAWRAELEEIRKAADRGARLTTQLLGFTRSDSVRPQLLDLNQVIYDMERMLRHIIGENIELRTECSPDLGMVAADPGQIEQVIVNLILNARDAMPAGGSIEIMTRPADDAEAETVERHGVRTGPCVFLIVSDTGHGIAPEAMDHVFKPFFTTKERGSGTGLGLSTVHNIVRQSGGAVWVTSTPGKGATFTVCLPRAEAAIGPAPAPGAAKSYTGDETILLVEDDASVRQLLARVLRDRGYAVLEACHSADAIAIFEKCGPKIHLLLTDLVMPGMSGLELTNRLRGMRPQLKILCMSGYTEEVLVHNGSLNPGMPFLRKPLRPDALAAGVREALDSPTLPFDPR
jgi:two-component system, cell cycle sensor histidine kinase and response regulator CckA